MTSSCIPLDLTENAIQKCITEALQRVTGGQCTRVAGFIRIECGDEVAHEVSLSGKESILSAYQSPITNNSPPLSLESMDRPMLESPPSEPLEISTPKVNRRKAYQPKKVPSEFTLPELTKSTDKHLDDLSSSSSTPDDPIPSLNPETLQASVDQAMTHSMTAVFPTPKIQYYDNSPAYASMTPMLPPTAYCGFFSQVGGVSNPSMNAAAKLGPGNMMKAPFGKVNGKTEPKRKIKPKPVSVGSSPSGRTSSPYVRGSGVSKRSANKEFSCNQCGEKFKSLNTLTEHTTEVHGCFRCTTCNSQFTQRSNLQRHSLKHLGYKPFICGNCRKEYYRKDHLVRHIEVSHPGSDPKTTVINSFASAECVRLDGLARAQAKANSEATGSPAPPLPIDGVRSEGASPLTAVDCSLKDSAPMEIKLDPQSLIQDWLTETKPIVSVPTPTSTASAVVAEMTTPMSTVSDHSAEEPQDLSINSTFPMSSDSTLNVSSTPATAGIILPRAIDVTE